MKSIIYQALHHNSVELANAHMLRNSTQNGNTANMNQRYTTMKRHFLLHAFTAAWLILAATNAQANPPTILASPTNLTVVAGFPFSLNVAASGGMLQYQWQKDWADVAGATNSVLTFSHGGVADTGVYSVRVSNGDGSTNSDSATVSVVTNQVVWSDDFSSNPTLNGWVTDQFLNLGGFSWQAARRTFTISNGAANDSILHRAVTGLLPNHIYRLHAWVKGSLITGDTIGANISQWNENIFNFASISSSTFEWTKLILPLVTDATGKIEFACRLGHFGSTVTGVAIFGNLALEDSLTITNVSRPIVRVAYIIPSNRSPQTNGVANLKKLIPYWQAWYRDQMERYGFGSKTFEFETDADGVTPKIYVVNVAETDSTLRGSGPYGPYNEPVASATAAGVPVGALKQVWLLIPEAHLMMPDGSFVGGVFLGGGAGSGDYSGTAVVDSTALARFDPSLLTNDVFYDGIVWPAIGPYPMKFDYTYNYTPPYTFVWFEGATFSSISSSAQGGALHELTHAFGLAHDFRNDGNFGNLMANGFRGWRGNYYPSRYPDQYVRLSYASALALNTSRYFNASVNYTNDTPPVVSITSTNLQPATNGLVNINFYASDSDGLAAAILSYVTEGAEVVNELALSTQVTNANFVTPYFESNATNEYYLSVFDRQGNKQDTAFSVHVISNTNRAPRLFVRASPASVAVNDAVVLDASQTTVPNGSANLQVQWDFDGDGVYDTPLSTNLIFTNYYAIPGMKLVRARAVDAQGASSTSTLLDVRVYEPLLGITGANAVVRLDWPVWMAGYNPQFNDSVTTSNWQSTTTAVSIVGMTNIVSFPTTGIPQRFFRLAKP